VFWLLLWVARGGATLLAVRYLTATERAAVVFYAPLQVAYALALVMIAVRLEKPEGAAPRAERGTGAIAKSRRWRNWITTRSPG